MDNRTKFPIAIKKQHLPYIVIVVVFALIIVVLRPLQPIDNRLSAQAVALSRSWLPFMTFLSFLGTSPFVSAVAVIWAAVEKLVFKRGDRAILMLLSLLALPAYELAKILVHRARPITPFILQSGLHGDSFPSGHSAGSFAIYATLGYLLYRFAPKPWTRPIAIIFISLIGLIGFSRVYIGAHFPTDVLGGWLIGLLVLLGIRQGLAYYEAKHHQKQQV